MANTQTVEIFSAGCPACQAGDPVIMSDAQMDKVLQQFQGYGKQPIQAQ